MWRLVITHLHEPLDWVRAALPNGTAAPEVWVYHKGAHGGLPTYVYDPRWRWIEVPNVGREAETVARHLYEEYDALAPMTAFLQGSPRRHNGGVLDRLRLEMASPRRNATGCTVLGAPMISVQTDGCPHHCGLALQATCERLQLPRCAAPFRFAAGGMMAVSRERARRLRRETYKLMFAQLHGEARYTKRAPLYPYIYERLWKRVFACKG